MAAGAAAQGAPKSGAGGGEPLTEAQKQFLRETLEWPESQIKKSTMDADGIVYLKTDNCALEGSCNKNGVPYFRKRVTVNGVTIEGVFPKFESAFDLELPPEKYRIKAYQAECCARLREAAEKDPSIKERFTKAQWRDVLDGKTPRGYAWHHNEEPGKMQLVKRKRYHDRTQKGAAHTGGNVIWGKDCGNRKAKGEKF